MTQEPTQAGGRSPINPRMHQDRILICQSRLPTVSALRLRRVKLVVSAKPGHSLCSRHAINPNSPDADAMFLKRAVSGCLGRHCLRQCQNETVPLWRNARLDRATRVSLAANGRISVSAFPSDLEFTLALAARGDGYQCHYSHSAPLALTSSQGNCRAETIDISADMRAANKH